MEILRYPLKLVPEFYGKQATELQNATWPEGDSSIITPFQEKLDAEGAMAFFAIHHELLGYAELFPRTIYCENGPLQVWGLASVCVAKSSQGSGIGKTLVKACFQEVDHRKEVCLFQTMVPGFYDKLGCRIIDNTIINHKNQETPDKNPFWDDFIMIYPASYDWPEGTIDLNGLGY